MKIGCIHGRFQPFHKDHLKYALEAISQCDYLWIGITQYDIGELLRCDDLPSRGTFAANPLTYIERIEIIRDSLLESGIDAQCFGFVPFPIDQPEKLYQFVESSTVCFTTIRESWNLSKIDILEKLGYKVVVLWENLDEKLVSSTIIRDSILLGTDNWESFVSPSTKEHLLRLDIRKRLK